MTEEHYLISLKITARCSCFQCSFEIVFKGGKGERRVSSPPKGIQGTISHLPRRCDWGFSDGNRCGKGRVCLPGMGLCRAPMLHPSLSVPALMGADS